MAKGKVTLTGDKRLDRKLEALESKVQKRIARGVLARGLTPIAKEAKRLAPRGKGLEAAKSIGKRNKKNKRKGIHEAKVGVNVGKKAAQQAPHAHLVALGTKPRRRRRIGGKFAYLHKPSHKQLATGTMPANNFVKEAFAASSGKSLDVMKQALAKALENEAKKG